MSDEKLTAIINAADAPTPGPWRWRAVGSCGETLEVLSDDGVTWGTLEGPDNRVVMVAEGPVIPSDADARLIAEAPETKRERDEMLALLRELIVTCSVNGALPPGQSLLPTCGRCHGCRRAALLARIDSSGLVGQQEPEHGESEHDEKTNRADPAKDPP